MGVSSATQWWHSWQLQILVLGSLGIQYLLVILGALRRRRIPPLVRFFTWVSFVGGDAVVLYALGVLSWKLYQCNSAHSCHDLEVFWAPALLMHLGGQMCITAYNLEDNELWTRQILFLLSKVIATVYVFRMAWSPSADNRLLVSAILLSISGTIKCVDKIINLKLSSFDSLSTIVNDVQRSTSIGLEEYVREARDFFEESQRGNTSPATFPPLMPIHSPEKLFVDFAHGYSDRLANIKSFWPLGDIQMYVMIKSGLTETFELLYTKGRVPRIMSVVVRAGLAATMIILSQTHPPRIGNCQLPPIRYLYLFLVTLASAIGLPIVSICLFHSIDKQAYTGVDVTVTLLFLYGTLALEFLSMYLAVHSSREWPDMLAQHSLFGFFAHNKRHSRLMSFAKFFQCKDLLDRYWCMDPSPSLAAAGITEIVRGHINMMWTDYIEDAGSYMDCTNIRGQWILEVTDCVSSIGWSLDKPFDECVLMWHIATDFCFRSTRHSAATHISNYMVHLLFANPEMLMPGSRKSIFTDTYNQLGDILRGEGTCKDADGLVQKIIDKLVSGEVPRESIIYHAWMLAETLMDMDYNKMQVVIGGVWVEMLCFSAGRCRGYLHAKSLGSGGEFLSFVSLLLVYSGMPTLPDRFQATPFDYSSSSASDSGSEGTTTASPSGPQGEGTTAELDQIVVETSDS